jgi:hypothetical protein
MSGNERISRPANLIAEYRAQAVRCREDAKRTRLFERRYELEAEAEHLEQLVEEISAPQKWTVKLAAATRPYGRILCRARRHLVVEELWTVEWLSENLAPKAQLGPLHLRDLLPDFVLERRDMQMIGRASAHEWKLKPPSVCAEGAAIHGECVAVMLRTDGDVRLRPVREFARVLLDALHGLEVADLFEPGIRLHIAKTVEEALVLCVSRDRKQKDEEQGSSQQAPHKECESYRREGWWAL